MMARLSSGVSTSSENTGICCGPVSIASYSPLVADARQGRRVLAVGQRAAGALEVVAGRAVGAEQLAAAGDVLLAEPRRVVLLGSGIAGPGPSEATYAASAAISSSV